MFAKATLFRTSYRCVSSLAVKQRILSESLKLIPALGFGRETIISAIKNMDYSPALVGIFKRGEAELVDFMFEYVTCSFDASFLNPKREPSNLKVTAYFPRLTGNGNNQESEDRL